MYRRIIEQKIRAALADTRVVLLNGPRQSGKSTLAQELTRQIGGRYLSLDDPTLLALAKADPKALTTAADSLTVIDEVQLAPGLFPLIKQAVDQDPRPGRFLLTGSANVFLLPKLAESLAGRMEIIPLAPLAQTELSTDEGASGNWVDSLCSASPWQARTCATDRSDVCRRIVAGGFPEALARPATERRNAWFHSYVTALLQRDVRNLANLDGLSDLPRLLTLLAARSASLLNISEISRSIDLPHTTLRRYLGLLEAIFLVQPLPAWSANLGKRLVKAPKTHLVDSGLAAQLRGDSDATALSLSPHLGPLLETFVVQEVRRLLAASTITAALYHYRSNAGQEIDLLLEMPGQGLAAVEIKAAATLNSRDFNSLRTLCADTGDNFKRGVILYLGNQRLQFADKLWAEPLSMLWSTPQ